MCTLIDVDAAFTTRTSYTSSLVLRVFWFLILHCCQQYVVRFSIYTISMRLVCVKLLMCTSATQINSFELYMGFALDSIHSAWNCIPPGEAHIHLLKSFRMEQCILWMSSADFNEYYSNNIEAHFIRKMEYDKIICRKKRNDGDICSKHLKHVS